LLPGLSTFNLMIDISAVYGDSNRVNVLSESNTTGETENVTNAKDK